MSQDFVVNYPAGGNIDKVKIVNRINEIGTIKDLGTIKNFATFSTPFNEMVYIDMPAIVGDYKLEYNTPSDKPCEIMAITVTCSGYSENDCYDMFVGKDQWFKNWAVSEVKEGLFLGTSTFVYEAVADTKISLTFKNKSGTSKRCWLGIRMLVDNTTT